MTIHDRPMTFHPLDSAISAGVRACDELGAPVPKYTVVVEIIGNSREEILKRIRSLDTNWDYEYCERDEIDSTDGTTTIRMRHTNPAQTPEEYYQALMAWASARRVARRASSDAGAS